MENNLWIWTHNGLHPVLWPLCHFSKCCATPHSVLLPKSQAAFWSSGSRLPEGLSNFFFGHCLLLVQNVVQKHGISQHSAQCVIKKNVGDWPTKTIYSRGSVCESNLGKTWHMMHLRDASYVQVSQMVSEERCLSRAILKEGKQRWRLRFAKWHKNWTENQ